MKFFLLSALAVSAFANEIFSRDLDTIKGVLSNVGTNLAGLSTAVKAFNGNPEDLLKAANALQAALDDGKAKVDPTGQLSFTEAIGLQGPVGDLQKQGDALLADFKAAKDKIAGAGLCTVTLDQVTIVNKKSNDLINTIVSKVPEAAQGIAKNLSAGLIKDLQDAQDTYSGDNCKNTGGGGGGGGSPTGTGTGTGTGAPTGTSTPTNTGGGSPTGTTTGAGTGTGTGTSVPTETMPTIVPTTTAGSGGGGGCSCPPAQTVTVTVIDSAGCPTQPATLTTTSCPTCTTPVPVTTTTTKKSCPAPAKRAVAA